MDEADEKPFQPDWVSPPGDTIEDILEVMHLSNAEAAERLELTLPHFVDLLFGKHEIDGSLARRLHELTGVSVQFWESRERIYRAEKKRLGIE